MLANFGIGALLALLDLFRMIASEMLIGGLIGLLGRIFFAALETLGTAIAQEIGLANAQIDDVLALPLQFGGARQHGEGVFLADAGEGGGDMKGHDGLDVSVSNGLHTALATVFAGKRAGMQARPTSGPCKARMKNSMIYRDKAPCGRPERAG